MHLFPCSVAALSAGLFGTTIPRVSAWVPEDMVMALRRLPAPWAWHPCDNAPRFGRRSLSYTARLVCPTGLDGRLGTSPQVPSIEEESWSTARTVQRDDKASRRRRAVHERCKALQTCVSDELRAEIARDAWDGKAAIPPLAPADWAVHHQAGTSFFTMQRTLRPHQSPTSSTAANASASGRFCSVQEESLGRPRKVPYRDTTTPTHTAYPSGSLTAGQREASQSLRQLVAQDVVRSDIHLHLFVPFRVTDLTLVDPNISICEWSCFNLLVYKTRPPPPEKQSLQQPQPPRTVLLGQQRLWDQHSAMFFRLATANSELRMRSVQFLSQAEARALEEHCVFGRGDPVYLELARRQRQLESRQAAKGCPVPWRPVDPSVAARAEFCHPTQRFVTEPQPHASVRQRFDADGYDRLDLLCNNATHTGDVARALCYQGPYLTELSKELHEALLHYLMVDLGVSSQVSEYVCQMQYFMEQEEYVGWLARWRHMAEVLRKSAVTD